MVSGISISSMENKNVWNSLGPPLPLPNLQNYPLDPLEKNSGKTRLYIAKFCMRHYNDLF